MSSAQLKESLLGSAKSARGLINMMTLATAFVLSIMVINNYRQCERYPKNKPIVKGSYIFAIIVLVVVCLLFSYDLAILGHLI